MSRLPHNIRVRLATRRFDQWSEKVMLGWEMDGYMGHDGLSPTQECIFAAMMVFRGRQHMVTADAIHCAVNEREYGDDPMGAWHGENR